MSSGHGSERSIPQARTRPSRLRKLIKIGAAVVGVPLVATAATLGVGYYQAVSGVEDPPHGERVGPATVVVDGYVAAFVLEAGDGSVALVDAGNTTDAGPIRGMLGELGYDAGDVVAILLTHGHPDHRAGAPRFPGARIYAHVDELPLLRGESRAQGPIPWLAGHAEPLEVTHPVEDGESFEIGELSVRAFHLPGHTPGSVAWLVDGTLFLGDSATSRESGVLEASPWVFTADTERNRRSLAALPAELDRAGADVEHLVFNHAAPLQGLEPLRQWAAEHRNRR